MTARSLQRGDLALQDGRLFREACYVDGRWVKAAAGCVLEVDDPATGEVIGVVPRLGREEACGAIEAAARAFALWRRRLAKDRARIMRRWFELMMDH